MPHHATTGRLVTGITEGTAALDRGREDGTCLRTAGPSFIPSGFSSAGLQGEDRPVQPQTQSLERLPQQGLRLHPHAGGQRHPSVLGAGV